MADLRGSSATRAQRALGDRVVGGVTVPLKWVVGYLAMAAGAVGTRTRLAPN
jgi:hypothetical protein